MEQPEAAVDCRIRFALMSFFPGALLFVGVPFQPCSTVDKSLLESNGFPFPLPPGVRPP